MYGTHSRSVHQIMILCDLPYGITQNQWDCLIPLDLLWEQYWRIIKPNGAIVLTSYGIFTAHLILSQPKTFKYKWVWEKSKSSNFLNAKKQPLCSTNLRFVSSTKNSQPIIRKCSRLCMIRALEESVKW